MGKEDNRFPADAPCGMAALNQFGALCWRRHGKGHEVLLITSRDTGRWVIPKGWPMREMTPPEAAAREAWEEAGVQGTTTTRGLGFFAYRKGLAPDRALPCVVEVFALKVDRLADSYPEKGQRRRKWFRPEKAAKKVDEPDLRQLILAFVPPEAEAAPRRRAGDKA
jgi:8-oxo-dGTP pyrophosphatase MutT (NUDIX family)